MDCWTAIMQTDATRAQTGINPGRWVERRLGSRVPVDLPVDVIVDGFHHRCRVTDLSPTGMVLALTRTLALREPPMLGKYELQCGARLLCLTARTVWRRDTAQAARFVALSEDEREAIATLVQTALRTVRGDLARLDLAERQDRAGNTGV
jgi:hypothetical protein